MNDRLVPADDVVERMLQRRAARGDFTGLLFRASDLVARTPQRRHRFGWWARSWDVRRGRWAVVGAALVLIISVTGVVMLGGPWRASVTGPVPPAGTPSSSPTQSSSPTRSPSAAPFPAPTPRPTRTASPTPAPSPLLGLAPGTYSSQVWQPRLTYTVPDGWWNDADDKTGFVLGKGHESPDNIELLVDLYPPGTDCGMAPDWARPHGVADLMDYFTNSPGIELISREAVSLGGLDGWRVVIGPSSTSNCGDRHQMSFIVHWYDGIPFGHGLGDPEELTILESPDGRTIGIQVRAGAALKDEAAAIVESFEFDTESPDPGGRTSQLLTSRLTYSLPPGWTNGYEDRATLNLRHGPSDSIDVIANVFAPTIDSSGCSSGMTMSRDAADRIVAYWTSHPGLIASAPEAFSIGDLKGWRVVASRNPEWSEPCASATGPTDPVDFLHLWDGIGIPQGSGIGTDPKTLIVLDLPDGMTIGIKMLLSGTPALEDEALEIVKSFEFAPGP